LPAPLGVFADILPTFSALVAASKSSKR